MKEGKVRALRESTACKIYVYLRTEEICRRFYEDAENEDFMFGANVRPTESPYNDIIVLGKHSLSHTGFVGHLAFHNCNRVVGGCVRIDYEKYISGEQEYHYTDKYNDISYYEEIAKKLSAESLSKD